MSLIGRLGGITVMVAAFTAAFVPSSTPAMACLMHPSAPPVPEADLFTDCSWWVTTEDGEMLLVWYGSTGETYPTLAEFWDTVGGREPIFPDGSVYQMRQVWEDQAPQRAAIQQSDEVHEDLPWPIFLAGSIIVPLAVLFVFSFAVKRGSGGH